MLRPLFLQDFQDIALGFCVDDVDFALAVLQEAIDAVYGLDEVVELVSDAGEDHLVAMALEVASGAAQDRLRTQDAVLSVREVDNSLLADVEIQTSPDSQ